MKRILLAVVALSFVAAARAEDTAMLYARKCATCHGKDGKGTPIGLKMGAKDLGASTLSEADVAGVITAGRGKMTPYKNKLSEDEIKSLAKYVKAGLK